jgi:response regulator RpfG family c-di-GMP phosphodiesterase
MTKAINILIIDDNEDDRLLYRRALQQDPVSQYNISEADNGDNTLLKVQESVPSCILLDYSMPGQSGVEILKLYIQIILL